MSSPRDAFRATFALLLRYSSKGAEAELMVQAKGWMAEAYKLTPPAGGKGRQGRAAQKAGESRIERNFTGGFRGVSLVGQRRITKVFGRPLATPVFVKTREITPDVAAAYKARMNKTRRLKRHLYVDQRKLTREMARQKKKVGILASGFNLAANRLGAKVPSYARRHGTSDGRVEVIGPPRMLVRVTNAVQYADRVSGLRHRLSVAMGYQVLKMQRQIPYLIRASAKRAGLSVR